jgi:putative aldouronate transport system substrate-binding protein
MKKSTLSIISLILMLSMLFACTQSSDTPASATVAPTEKPVAAAATEKPADPAANAGTPETPETAAQVDISKHLDMTIWLSSEPTNTNDVPMVIAEVNKILNETINVTLTVRHIGNTNTAELYALKLASGEPFDLIYTANYLNFPDHARNGAFLALDDLFQYTPDLVNSIPEHFWVGMTSDDGHYYAVPSTVQNPRGSGYYGYRMDLATKWGLPEITNIDTLQTYYDAVLENRTTENFFPINFSGPNDHFGSLYINSNDYLDNATVGTGSGSLRIFLQKYSAPEAGFNCYYFDDNFSDWVVMMKEWLNKGYWSRSALSGNVGTSEAFGNGTSGTFTGNYDTMRYGSDSILTREPALSEGWDIWAYRADQQYPSGKVAWYSPLQDCTSIPRQAQDPIRAMLLLEQLHCNQEVNDLVERGIYGVHWELNDEGSFYFLYSEKGTWDFKAWAFFNVTTYRDRQFMWPRYKEFNVAARTATTAAYNEGFRFSKPTQYADMQAEVETILSQYNSQLYAGLANDPVADLAIARQRLLDAGIEEYLADVNAEWKTYYEANVKK